MQYKQENQDYLGGLNEQQRDAVLCKADIVYVNAGPGTGKTALLTSKLVDIIQTSTSPEKIVALSYTNTAARQIGERFKEKLAKSGISKDYSLFSGTIHSFCYRMLKQYSDSFDYTILDDEEFMELAEDISRRYKERYTAKQILACINAKQINLPEDVVQTVSGVKSAFKIISVQDILTLFIKALDEDPGFRSFIHDQVTVMAFDEAQDLTEQHYSILDRILSINPAVKVFLVGDPRQNIFEFNGGSYKNLDDFLHRHTSHVVKSLTITYRCGQAIADYVNTFKFTDCNNLKLQSRCTDAGRISVKHSFSEEDEAKSVLESIREIGNLNSCAVLCNNLKYLKNLISLLRVEQIPYKVYGGRKTLKRHIRFLNHILRIINNENPYSIRKIADYAGIDLLENGKRKKSKFFASPLGQLISSIREKAQSCPFSETATTVLSEIMMDPHDDASVQSDYMDFQTWSYDYDTVSDYLAAFATDRERFSQFFQADYAECLVSTDNGFLTLSTIHSAKGLEWDHVFIMGLCEGVFPNPYFCTAKTQEGIDDFFNAEWKKMYVASTRAKESLCLSYACMIRRKGYSSGKLRPDSSQPFHSHLTGYNNPSYYQSSIDGLDSLCIDPARPNSFSFMQEQEYLTNATIAEGYLHDRISNLDHEEVWAVFLTGSHSVISEMMLSRGTLTQTAIDCRTVLRNALLVNAASVILLHNHPSGDPRPSVQDIHFTDRLRKACSLMDIQLLDHIVIGKDGFFSFADERTLKY